MTWTLQIAHVSQSTSQDHMATAFHFLRENGGPTGVLDFGFLAFCSSLLPNSVSAILQPGRGR